MIPGGHGQSRSGFLNGFERGAQKQLDTIIFKLGLNQAGHITVQGRQHLIGALLQEDLHTSCLQILRQFHANEAGAHHHGSFYVAFIHLGFDGRRIGNGAKGIHALQIRSRQGRHKGTGPG